MSRSYLQKPKGVIFKGSVRRFNEIWLWCLGGGEEEEEKDESFFKERTLERECEFEK